MIGHTLNGYTITDAVTDVTGDGVMIVAERRNDAGDAAEYVAARVGVVTGDDGTLPREWYQGDYFSVRSDGPINARARAMSRALVRAGLPSFAIAY